MELEGKRVAVLAEDMYEDPELWYPMLRMKEAGAEVNVVGPQKTTYKSKVGYPVAADTAIEQVRPDDYDAVIIPGGYAPDKMRRNATLLSFVRDMHQQQKVVAFICHAGWVPASAGILRGRRITSVAAIKDDMVNAGADWVDEEVVVDGRMISSRVPTDLPAFCREIIKVMAKVPAAA